MVAGVRVGLAPDRDPRVQTPAYTTAGSLWIPRSMHLAVNGKAHITIPRSRPHWKAFTISGERGVDDACAIIKTRNDWEDSRSHRQSIVRVGSFHL